MSYPTLDAKCPSIQRQYIISHHIKMLAYRVDIAQVGEGGDEVDEGDHDQLGVDPHAEGAQQGPGWNPTMKGRGWKLEEQNEKSHASDRVGHLLG